MGWERKRCGRAACVAEVEVEVDTDDRVEAEIGIGRRMSRYRRVLSIGPKDSVHSPESPDEEEMVGGANKRVFE